MPQKVAYFALKLLDSTLNWLYFEKYFQIKNSGSTTAWARSNWNPNGQRFMSLNISLIFGGLTIKPLFRNPFLIGPNRESHISDFSTHRHQISLWDTSIISWPQTSAADSSRTQPHLSESAKKWVHKNPTDGPLKWPISASLVRFWSNHEFII